MEKQGWIKIHRKICEWEWYGDGNTFRLFFHLLLIANHKDSRWQGREIKRGQAVVGRKALSITLRISEQSIRTSLERLKSTNEITIKTTNRFTIVTVVNYDSYQERESQRDDEINQPANQQLTNNQPTTNQQLTTLEEVKKLRSKEVTNISRQKKFKAPSLSEIKTEVTEKKLDRIDPEYFFDHHEENGWTKANGQKIKNWKMTLSLWQRKAIANGWGLKPKKNSSGNGRYKTEGQKLKECMELTLEDMMK